MIFIAHCNIHTKMGRYVDSFMIQIQTKSDASVRLVPRPISQSTAQTFTALQVQLDPV